MFVGLVELPVVQRGATLSYLYVSLSNICNARCLYCDVHQQPKDKLRWDEVGFRRLFGEAKAMGCRTVHFLGGGEPLVAPSFESAASVCVELDLAVVITTNGSHLGKRLSGALGRAWVAAILVSLDSHQAELHDQIRGLRGLWNKAVDGIRRFREARPETRFVLNHVVTRQNVAALGEFLDFASAEGIAALNLIPVKDHEELATSAEQRRELVDALIQLRERGTQRGIELLFNDVDAEVWARRGAGLDTDHTYRCVFPEHALYLDCPTGDVFPCDCTVHRQPSSTFALGNVANQSLEQIWMDEPIKRLRETLRSPCDPGCKADCDWNNMRTNEVFLARESKLRNRAAS